MQDLSKHSNFSRTLKFDSYIKNSSQYHSH